MLNIMSKRHLVVARPGTAMGYRLGAGVPYMIGVCGPGSAAPPCYTQDRYCSWYVRRSGTG